MRGLSAVNQALPTIFVQIAAYRDPDLPATLHNLLARAAHPERLHFGICLQLDASDPLSWREQAFPDHAHLQVRHVAAADSRGACWARSEAQTFYQEEDLLLQIDSHMRAVEHWDEVLIETWTECSDPNAVLSVYPNGFEPPETLQMGTLPVMAAAGFDDYGILKFQGISRYQWPEQQPERPILGAFIAGGFLFGPGRIVKDVPYDPSLYFYGEEVSMSARLWTHGYNIYCPNRHALFHLYKRSAASGEQATTHWSDHSDWFKLNRRSLVRVHTLLASLEVAPTSLTPTTEDVDDLNEYWLGNIRSLKQYQDWTGVDFLAQTISESAAKGVFTPAEHISR